MHNKYKLLPFLRLRIIISVIGSGVCLVLLYLVSGTLSSCAKDQLNLVSDPFSGLFVGVQCGPVQGSSKTNRNRQGGAFGNIPSQAAIADSALILGGQLYASKNISEKFNVGLEFFAGRSFLKMRANDQIYFRQSLRVKASHMLGIAGRLGVVVGSSLFYLKPGMVFTKYDVATSFLNILDNSGQPIPSRKREKFLRGFNLGIGVAVTVPNSKVTLGGEVSTINYANLKYIHSMPAGIPGNIHIKFRPKMYTFMLKADFKLGGL